MQQGAAVLAPVEAALTAAVRQVPVLHSDETGVRQAGTLAWAHVANTNRLTHSAIHAKRGRAATAAIGTLPDFAGVSVHDDGWAAYRAHLGCRQALGHIQHLRELTFLEEQYQQSWAKELTGGLREMKPAVDQARADGRVQLPLPATAREALVTRYRALLAAGLFGQRCAAAGIRSSMGSVGDCFDHALVESLFATLECELLAQHRFRTYAEARAAVFAWIEVIYHRQRRHSALGSVAPAVYERTVITPTPGAA